MIIRHDGYVVNNIHHQPDLLGELLAEQRLVFASLSLLDQVDDHHRAPVPLQQLVEVLARGHGKRVLRNNMMSTDSGEH